MKNPVFATIFTVTLLFSCSTSDEGEENPHKDAYELEEKIIGKWDVDNQDVVKKFSEKQSTPVCYIFSLIFKADGTFIINYQDGTITGNYVVEGENLISLGDAGSIGNIRFSSYGISFSARLEEICFRTLSAIRDDEHIPGTCYTFLNCLDDSVWISTNAESVVFLKFKNQPLKEFFVRQSYFSALNCRTGISNEAENVTSVMIANYTDELRIILKEKSPEVYSYTRLDNGKIQEEIETTEGTSLRIFENASEDGLQAYTGYAACGEKTYVPDDIFEKELIRMGFDDVMDDYVLTENINSIQQFWISDHNYPVAEVLESLIGLEDFTALTSLEIQVRNLAEIDLSGNINLETIFLGSPALTSLDLSHNTKLRGLYLEFAPMTSLDISKNTELIGVELQLMPITSLDISKNAKLEMLTIEGGGFKELIAAENPVLWHLNLSGNDELENVDVHYFPNLKELILSNNMLSGIDVSTLYNLENLEVQENILTSLDVSNNEHLYHFWATENPDLNCIEVAQVHLDRIEEENIHIWWEKDNMTSYSLACE